MGEAGRDIEGSAVVGAELDRGALEIGRRVAAKVDQDVEDRTGDAADELGLAMRRRLEMQSADGPPPPVERNARLGEAAGQSARGELSLVECTGKEAALILLALEVDRETAADREFPEQHRPNRSFPNFESYHAPL